MMIDMEKSFDWKEELCSVVSERIGHAIKRENIRSDEYGWKSYIPSYGLFPMCPLIMCDENKQIHIIIPCKTYKNLESGKQSVLNFFEQSYWHYGFYQGGCDILKAIFWKPLEGNDVIGIKDTNKIKHFFELVSQEAIPEEVYQQDDRKRLVGIVKEQIFGLYGFSVSEFRMYESDGICKKILMKPADKNNIVDVYLPSYILIMLLYYPWVMDCRHYVETAEFWIGRRFTNEQIAIPKDVTNVGQFCREFWKDIRWYTSTK